MSILAEEGLARLKTVTPKTVTTPCGTFEGLATPATDTICGVDIVRSGGILLEAVRKIAPDSKSSQLAALAIDPSDRSGYASLRTPYALTADWIPRQARQPRS
jgi:uracil phosphoribosyltransferase